MTLFLQLTVSGLMVGAVYALIALGFVLVFKASGIFNLAQGELVMMGSFFCYFFLVQVGFNVALSLILSLVIAAMLGWMLERLALRPMIGQPLLSMVMMTIALGMLLRGVVTAAWGQIYGVFPEFIPTDPVALGSVVISQELIWCFIIAMVIVAIFTYYFRYTRSGLGMRAVAEDHQVSQSAGISVRGVFSLVWVISALVSAVGGILLGHIIGVNPTLSVLGLKALPVVLLGGLDSIQGAIIAGLIVGVLENIAAGYLEPVLATGMLKDAFPFFVLIFVLFVRPHGLFGTKRIERI